MNREEKKDSARTEQCESRHSGPKPVERPAPCGAQRDHLDELDRAEDRHRDEAGGEDARICRHQRLAKPHRQCGDRERGDAHHAFRNGTEVARLDVSLVTPLLSGANDPVLGRADEVAAWFGRSHQSNSHGQRDAGSQHLAEQRPRPAPEGSASPYLCDREADPWRDEDQVDPERHGGHDRARALDADDRKEDGIRRELDQP